MAVTQSQVEHNGDGMVFVRDAATGKTYVDTVANFNADFGVTMLTLPAGADHRIYAPGVRHVVASPVTVLGGGPLPWTLGDTVIANINTGLTNQKNRQPPGAHPPGAP